MSEGKLTIKTLRNIQLSADVSLASLGVSERFIRTGSVVTVPESIAAAWLKRKLAAPYTPPVAPPAAPAAPAAPQAPTAPEQDPEGGPAAPQAPEEGAQEEPTDAAPAPDAEAAPEERSPVEIMADLDGVEEELAGKLVDHGFTSLASVAEADIQSLTAVKGIGNATAKKIKASAQALIAGKDLV